MAEVNLTLSLSFRHRWLGVAFTYAACLPNLVGFVWSDQAEERIAHIVYRLMGPKITAT